MAKKSNAKKARSSSAARGAPSSAVMSRSYYAMARSSWDIVAMIFAVAVIFIELALMFSKPVISFALGGKYISVTNGILAFAGVTGGLLWAVVEVMTPPRRRRLDIFLRFFGSFIIGFFIGGFFGYYFMFGQYLLVPMYNGNMLATFEVIAIYIAFVIMVINAAWAHNKGFRANTRAGAAVTPR